MLELIAFHFLLCFLYSVWAEISPDASWLTEVATTYQMFFSSMLYDQEKLFNKKTQISLLKNNVLLSMHYLTLATLFDHVLPVYTCEMFCFHSYDPRALQICVNLIRDTSLVSREKKVAKFVYLLATTMYACLIFWMNMIVYRDLVVHFVLFD